MTRTHSSRTIRNDLNLSAARVNSVFRVTRATKATQVAYLRIRRRPVPASYYSGWKAVKQIKGRTTKTTARLSGFLKRRPKAGGVTVTFQKSKGPIHFPGGFVAVTKSGHLGLFIRQGKKRLPIKEILGPNVQSMFKEIEPAMLDYGSRQLARLFDAELTYALKKR